MIYTVTLNPSLDYIVNVEDFAPGRVNRTTGERILPGGKGINVSQVLKNLGVDSTVLGFVAGFTGEQLKNLVQEAGLKEDFITVKEGMTRINVKIRHGLETEINGQGPAIGPEEISGLYQRLACLGSDDILVLAGSIPGGMPQTIYMDILDFLKERRPRVVVDATKELLMNTLKYNPFLIKPNHHELGEIFGVTLNTREEVIPYGRRLQELGARNVLVSMGPVGAVLLSEEGEVFQAPAPQGTVINSVGAGDSMVAGFLAGFRKQSDYRKAFLLGLCAGSASAFSENLAKEDQVLALLEQSGVR